MIRRWLGPAGIEIAIVVGSALVVIAALLALRAALTDDPLHRLTAHPADSGDPPGAAVRTGEVFLPRGGPYRFAVQATGPARVLVNDHMISADPFQPTRLMLDAGAARIRVAAPAPAGSRLLWHPPGRVTHHALEYLPASALRGDG